jgi:uncharacterized protein (TIGR00255 family)
MINSMTGYGESGGQILGTDYIVEIKAVNNRYLRTLIRLPEEISFLEERIEKLLRKNLTRGTVNYALRSTGSSSDDLFDINESALKNVILKLEAIQKSVGIERPVDTANLLSLPGIIKPFLPSEQTKQQIEAGIMTLTQEALGNLKEMRAEEGQFLETDLLLHCTEIESDLGYVRDRRHVVMQEHAERIKKRVDGLLAEARLKLDEETLAREVAILAERSDIAEELSRLDSHLHQFKQTCSAATDQAGRRLDFIAQEMLREANTIASKSNDVEIGNRVVNIKCRIDRIKEQTQNVE